MNESFGALRSRIGEAALLPVVVVEDADQAVALARSLVEGGLPVAEVTFRTSAAELAIRRISEEVPDIVLGAGTVLTPDQVKRARDAGAKFLVTPGFSPKVVETALSADLPIVPGINNPTGVEQAMGYGIDLVKFFPAEATGGISFLKALSGPYGAMRFIPTGGISPNNLVSYLSLPFVHACGGSWMVDPKLIRAGNFKEITRLTAEAVALAHSAFAEGDAGPRG